jgi:hypothetical protein
LWCRGDHRGAMDAMQKAGEAAVLVDFLEATVERPELITLEIAAGLLPQLAPLLESRHRCAAAPFPFKPSLKPLVCVRAKLWWEHQR